MQKRKIFLRTMILVMIMLLNVTNVIRVDASDNGNLKVSYLYVGQGDGALLESDNQFMMIDAGPVSAGPSVTSYLKERGVTKLDYVITTHPHPDHIGGFLDVFKNFKVGQLIKTQAFYPDNTHLKLLDLINEKQINVVTPTIGSSFQFGSATVTFLAPNSSYYEQFNDRSIVVKIVNGDNSFLFTGDAEAESEKEMLQNHNFREGYSLKADVLKVGHHGALSSTSPAFIEAVNPSISVVSCGINNAAKFPRKTTLANLKYTNNYRTDILGTITMTSDGKEITIDKQPSSLAKMGTNEYFNLFNIEAKSSLGGIALNDLTSVETYGATYNKPLSIEFMAEYGISSIDEIQYTLIDIDEDIYTADFKWKNLSDAKLELKGNFMGCVYVKFKNKYGNTIIRRTNGILLDTEPPKDCTVESNLNGINLLNTNATNVYNLKSNKKVTLNFDADFGISLEEKTEYMLVEKSASYNKNGKWKKGKKVTIGSGFEGRVYVRYTDWAGNVTIKKTNGFSVK